MIQMFLNRICELARTHEHTQRERERKRERESFRLQACTQEINLTPVFPYRNPNQMLFSVV